MDELNLEEFKILEKKKRADSYIYVVEKIHGPSRCPHCMAGEEQLVKHGKRERYVRDRDIGNHSVDLLILHGRYKCKVCGKTFYEAIECTDERAKTTKRLKESITWECFHKPFLQVARDFDISHTTVMRIFDESLQELDLNRKIYTPQSLSINRLFINRELLTIFYDPNLRLLLDVSRDISDPRNTSLLDIMEPDHKETIFTTPAYIQSRVLQKRLPETTLVLDRIHMEDFIDKVFLGQAKKILRQSKSEDMADIEKTMELFRSNQPLVSGDGPGGDIRRNHAGLLRTYDLLMDLKGIYAFGSRPEASEHYDEWKRAVLSKRDPLGEGLILMLSHMEKEFLDYFDYAAQYGSLKDIFHLNRLLENQTYTTSFEATRGRVLFGNPDLQNEEKEVRYVPLKRPLGKPGCSILFRRKILGVHVPSLIEAIKEGHF